MKMSKRTDTTSSSLMNIASLPLHRLNTHILGSVQLTVLSLSPSPSLFPFSLSLTREKETVQLSFLPSRISLCRQPEEKKRSEYKRKKTFILSGDTKGPFAHLLFSIFIIISMRDESRAIHHQSNSQLSFIYVQNSSLLPLLLLFKKRNLNWKKMN